MPNIYQTYACLIIGGLFFLMVYLAYGFDWYIPYSPGYIKVRNVLCYVGRYGLICSFAASIYFDKEKNLSRKTAYLFVSPAILFYLALFDIAPKALSVVAFWLSYPAWKYMEYFSSCPLVFCLVTLCLGLCFESKRLGFCRGWLNPIGFLMLSHVMYNLGDN